MGKLPYGPHNKHIQQTYGGDSDVMKFYCTRYGTSYGQAFSKFEPRQTRHIGTGYQSNFRPGVYYSARLDEVDNPAMGRIVADNYATVTQKSFRPYSGPTGTEALPSSIHQVGSGFVREKNLNIPPQNQIMKDYINMRVGLAPADIAPYHKPLLHTLKGKDCVELENGGYGPKFMSTEMNEKYQGHQRSNNGPNVCFKQEGSGFTHSYNVEPITFHPDYAHRNEMPAFLTERPTGISIHTTDYRPLRRPDGSEVLPNLADRSCRDTGFTSGSKPRPDFVHRVMGDAYVKAGDVPADRLTRTKKQDPTEYLNMTNPDNYSSVYQKMYQGHQKPDPSEAGRLGRSGVGGKEMTGFSENENGFVQTSDNPARFVTHYETKFLDRTPHGTDRQGHVWGGVQQQKPDGFSRSTEIHCIEKDYDSTAVRRGLAPYVGRSIVARDPFFDDHMTDHKMHRSATILKS